MGRHGPASCVRREGAGLSHCRPLSHAGKRSKAGVDLGAHPVTIIVRLHCYARGARLASLAPASLVTHSFDPIQSAAGGRERAMVSLSANESAPRVTVSRSRSARGPFPFETCVVPPRMRTAGRLPRVVSEPPAW